MKVKELGFEICNNGKENLKANAKVYSGEAVSAFGMTCDVDIYIDAAGADGIIAIYQAMGSIGSRMVVVAVKAGMRPVDALVMTFGQHALIGSDGYMPADIRAVMAIMESGRWDIESIITHEFVQDDLAKVIETAVDKNNSLNVVIKYEK